MEIEFKTRLAALLREADQATDEQMNGLMDRGDYCDLVKELSRSVRRLMTTCEELEERQRQWMPQVLTIRHESYAAAPLQ